MRLSGRRVLVVGASSGIGRASGKALAAEGARVAFAARRRERLEVLVAEVGPEALALTCDVRDERSCREAVGQAISALGGLDALVYAPGLSSFSPLREVDAETWRTVLDTNLVGASLVMRAAIDSLEESGGKAVFLSSISIDDAPPRFAQAPYVVSKIALEALVRAWQGEHRRVGFTTIAIGDTVTEFGQTEDTATLLPIVKRWAREGYLYGRMMDAASVAAQVVNALASSETVRRIAITPHYPDSAPDAGVESNEAWGAKALERTRGLEADPERGSSTDGD
jgi:NAD(P)-dependent dehydrogenase (short-subunit alcohol dehydrogenase family)